MNRNCKLCLLQLLLAAAVFCSCKKDKPGIAAPSGLTVTNISDTSATVSWSKVPNATAYSVFVSADPNFSHFVWQYIPLMVQQTSLTLERLTPATKHFVKVIASINSDSSQPGQTNFTTLDADGLLFIGSEDNNLYAFNARTGAVAWVYRTGGPIYGSPVVLDSVVYCASYDGKVYSVNAGGDFNWVSIQALSAEGYESSPIVKNGVVYIGDLGGWYYAFNASNGSLKWYNYLPTPYRSIGTSMVSDDAGTTLYMASFDGRVYGLDAATGAIKWTSVSTGNPIESGPALYNNTLYAGSFNRLYAFNAQTGATKWTSSNPQGVDFYASPTISNNKVLVGGEDGNFYSNNIADGSLNWMKQLPPGVLYSSPVVSSGAIYVGDVGKIYSLDEGTGNILWENDGLGSKVIYSGPVVSDNYVYAGNLDGTLFCMDRSTGVTKWSTTVPGATFQSSPCILRYSGKTFHPGVTGFTQ